MVFAADDAGRIYWFWPSFLDANSNPISITAASGPTPVELGEAVKHAFSAGRLRLFALFSAEAYDIKTIEARMTSTGNPEAARADWLWMETLEVLP